jgi:hypothetical protein
MLEILEDRHDTRSTLATSQSPIEKCDDLIEIPHWPMPSSSA